MVSMSKLSKFFWIGTLVILVALFLDRSDVHAQGSFDWDKPFGAPQYLLHATGHGTVNGPVKDDWLFLFPAAPKNGGIELPDGSGGTFGYSIDFQAGPFKTPREVCQGGGSRVQGKQFSAWNSWDSFVCGQSVTPTPPPGPAQATITLPQKATLPYSAYVPIPAQGAAGIFPAIPLQPPTTIACGITFGVTLIQSATGGRGPVDIVVADHLTPGLTFNTQSVKSSPPVNVNVDANNNANFSPITLTLPAQGNTLSQNIWITYTETLNADATGSGQQNWAEVIISDHATGTELQRVVIPCTNDFPGIGTGPAACGVMVQDPHLEVENLVSSSTALPGDERSFTIIVRNSGNILFARPVIVDNVIPGIFSNNATWHLVPESVDPPADMIDESADRIQWNTLGPIGPNSDLALTYKVEIDPLVPAGTVLTNDVAVHATALDIQTGATRELNAFDNATVEISPIDVGIALTLTAYPDDGCYPDTISYSATVTNTGYFWLDNVQLQVNQSTVPLSDNPRFPLDLEPLAPWESRVISFGCNYKDRSGNESICLYKGKLPLFGGGPFIDRATVTATPISNGVQAAGPVTANAVATVKALHPVLLKVTPVCGQQGNTGLYLDIEGACFTPGAVVGFQPEDGIEVPQQDPPNLGFEGPTKLRQKINIASNAPLGDHDIVVVNSNGYVSNLLQKFTVVPPCTFAISPSSQTFSPSGGKGSVSVSAPCGCIWKAASNNSWIKITAGDSGSGDGKVSYSVDAYTGFNSRTGTLTIAGKTLTVTQNAPKRPNLTPYQPSGWSDKIVVSNKRGTHTDDNPLYSNDRLYLDWAIINNGQKANAHEFYCNLYVDGNKKQGWQINSPLSPKAVQKVEDYALGSLTAGLHSLTIFVDPTGAIDEMNESDNAYTKTITILSPTITVTGPNGGEVWNAGTSQSIAWTYKGNPGMTASIRLLKGGTVQKTLSPGWLIGSNGTGSFTWKIPTDQIPGNDYKITVSSTVVPNCEDASDATFSITAFIPSPPILISPANGSNASGTTVSFSWNASTGANGYRVQVSRNAGFTDLLFDQTVGNVTGYAVPGFPNDGSTFYWRVRAANGDTWSDWSSAWSFVNGIHPGITVTAPNGGEVWNAGTSHSIAWTYQGNAGTTASVRLLKGGTVQQTLSSSVPIGSNGSGSFTWNIPTDQIAGTDYKIKISSNEVANCEDASDATFSINAFVPSPPTLISPGNGSNAAGTTISFSWNASTGATAYGIQVCRDTACTDVFRDDMCNFTPDTLSGFPNDGSTFSWRVRAGSGSTWSNWSAVWSFVNGTLVIAPPTLISPANGSNVSGTAVSFSWSASSGANNYHLQISRDAAFTDLFVDQALGNYTGANGTGFPNDGSTFWWRVRAGNGSTWSDWSAVWSFVNGTLVIAPPTLISPANGSNVSGTAISFSWSASSGANNYHLQISQNASFTSLVVDQALGNYTGANGTGFPNDGSTFWWRVRAGNGSTWSDWSAVWSFVNGTLVIQPPTLYAPANGSVQHQDTVSFSWSASSGANNYHLQISQNASFSSLVVDQAVGNNTAVNVTELFNYGCTYYWRVRAGNGSTWSGWSAVWWFK